MVRRNKAGPPAAERPRIRSSGTRRGTMTKEQQPAKPNRQEQEREPEGNTLQDASDEAVRQLESGDEPGHAGRGDYG
jgi:hypothetical protein